MANVWVSLKLHDKYSQNVSLSAPDQHSAGILNVKILHVCSFSEVWAFCVVATKHKNFPKKPLNNNKENILSLRYLSRPTFVPLAIRVVAGVFACKMQDAIALRFEQLSRERQKRMKETVLTTARAAGGIDNANKRRVYYCVVFTLWSKSFFCCCLLFLRKQILYQFRISQWI